MSAALTVAVCVTCAALLAPWILPHDDRVLSIVIAFLLGPTVALCGTSMAHMLAVARRGRVQRAFLVAGFAHPLALAALWPALSSAASADVLVGLAIILSWLVLLTPVALTWPVLLVTRKWWAWVSIACATFLAWTLGLAAVQGRLPVEPVTLMNAPVYLVIVWVMYAAKTCPN
jgi:hypothetical protein